MKILITGGGGFIGSHVVEHFQGKAEMVVFDDFSTGSRKNLEGLECEIIEGDVADAMAVTAAMEGCDYVFHFAAFVSVPESVNDPDKCFTINVDGTANVLKAAAKNRVKKVIFSSSCAVYGDSPELPKTESMEPEPKSPYAESKLKAERLCKRYADENKVSTCCFRFFNVFGPRQNPESQYAAAVPIFVRRALDDEPITIFGKGDQTRDFIYVKDVVRALIMAMEKLDGLFNLGTGIETSVNELAETVISIIGSESEIVHANPREGDIIRSYGDISRLMDEGFVAKHSLREGLIETIDWMRK